MRESFIDIPRPGYSPDGSDYPATKGGLVLSVRSKSNSGSAA